MALGMAKLLVFFGNIFIFDRCIYIKILFNESLNNFVFKNKQIFYL